MNKMISPQNELLKQLPKIEVNPHSMRDMPGTEIIPAPDPTEYYTSHYDKIWIDIYNFFNDPYYIYNEQEVLLELNESITVLPELFLGFSILVLILYGILISTNKTKNYPLFHTSFIKLSVLSLLFTLMLTFNNTSFSDQSIFFNNTIILDYLCYFSKQFILLISIIYFIILLQYINYEKINSFEYTILLLFSVLGIMLICTSNDLITAYLSIEVQSLCFYLLAAYKKNSVFSTESGLKYFILGAFSSSMFLFGSSLVYGVTGTTNFEDFKDLLVNVTPENIFITYNSFLEFNLLQFGLVFILISLFFKLALAPFHIWSPDVYEGSSTSSTFFFAVLPKLGIFILLIRFFYHGFFNFFDQWRYFIVGIALFSIIVGSFGGLEQRKIKSLLAYSSVSHMGYSLLAFSTFTFQGLQVLISYLLIYMLSGLCLWSILLSLKVHNKMYINKNNKDLSDFSNLVKSNNVLAIFFSTVLLSIAGFPPFIGFYVKLNIFLSTIETTLYFSSVIAILCSVISTLYYIRMIKVFYFEKKLTGKLYAPLYYQNSLVISICFYLLIYLFSNPNVLYLISYKMSFISQGI